VRSPWQPWSSTPSSAKRIALRTPLKSNRFGRSWIKGVVMPLVACARPPLCRGCLCGCLLAAHLDAILWGCLLSATTRSSLQARLDEASAQLKQAQEELSARVQELQASHSKQEEAARTKLQLTVLEHRSKVDALTERLRLADVAQKEVRACCDAAVLVT